MVEPAINAALPISIGAMAELMRRACPVVCNDSGASPVAAALRMPSVVFKQSDIGRGAPLDRQLHRCVQDPDRSVAGRETGSAHPGCMSLMPTAVQEARSRAATATKSGKN